MSKYEELVRFIANDYIELSYEKAEWQRNDWRKRCEKLLREEHMRHYTDEKLQKDIQAIHGKEEGLRQYNEIMEREKNYRKNKEEE